ncbi:hypothetical protein [Streptomyces sp. NBC_00280]|uniref:hypothetical protein n=1 Tax=Streptomyces sp. NBC_00280 TaxID=2975699 RepID=UPI0032522416
MSDNRGLFDLAGRSALVTGAAGGIGAVGLPADSHVTGGARPVLNGPAEVVPPTRGLTRAERRTFRK